MDERLPTSEASDYAELRTCLLKYNGFQNEGIESQEQNIH